MALSKDFTDIDSEEAPQSAASVPSSAPTGAIQSAMPSRRSSGGYDDLIESSASKHGVDPDLVRAVMSQESGGKRLAVSNKGAGGLMQLMPKTAERFGAKDRFDPAQNIDAGTAYLSYLDKRFNGDKELVLAAYNAGEGSVDKYGGIPPFAETRNYVPSVLSRYQKLKGGATGGASNALHPNLGQASEWEDADVPENRTAAPKGNGNLTWEDRGRYFMSGLANVPEVIGTGMQMFGRSEHEQGLVDLGTGLRDIGKNASDWWLEGLSEEAKNPSSLWNKVQATMLQSGPGMVTMGLAAYGAAPILSALGASAGVAGATAAAGSEGLFSALQNAAQQGDEARATLSRATNEQLLQMPEYVKALEMAGGDAEAAKEVVARLAEVNTFRDTLPWTAGTSLLTGGGALGSLASKAAGQATKGFVREVGGGMLKEGAQEAVQSGGEQAIQNVVAQQTFDPAREASGGVGEQMLIGGLTGGLMGGPAGVASHFAGGTEQPQAKPAPVKTNVEVPVGLNTKEWEGSTDLLKGSSPFAAGSAPQTSEGPIAPAGGGAMTLPGARGVGPASPPAQAPLEGELMSRTEVGMAPPVAGELPAPYMEGQRVYPGLPAPKGVRSQAPAALPAPVPRLAAPQTESTLSENENAVPTGTSTEPVSGPAATGIGGFAGGEQPTVGTAGGNVGKRRGRRASAIRNELPAGNIESTSGVAGGEPVAPLEASVQPAIDGIPAAEQMQVPQATAPVAEAPVERAAPPAPKFIKENYKSYVQAAAVEEPSLDRFQRRVKALLGVRALPTEQMAELNNYFNEVKGNAKQVGKAKAPDASSGAQPGVRQEGESSTEGGEGVRSGGQAEVQKEVTENAQTKTEEASTAEKQGTAGREAPEGTAVSGEKAEVVKGPAISYKNVKVGDKVQVPQTAKRAGTGGTISKVGRTNVEISSLFMGKHPVSFTIPIHELVGGKVLREGAVSDIVSSHIEDEIGKKKYPKKTKAKKEAPAEGGKEPWQMTREEFESTFGKPKKAATSYSENTAHRNAVHTAINQGKGKDIPPQVLREYPDLQTLAEDKARSEFSKAWAKAYPREDRASVSPSAGTSQGIETADTLVKELADDLGVDAPHVMEDGSLKGRGAYFPSKVKQNRVIKLHTTTTAGLNSTNDLAAAIATETVVHEFSHHVAETELEKSDEQTQADVDADYNAWVQAMSGKSVREILMSRMTPARAKAVSAMTDEQIAKSGLTEAYALNRDEWLADNAARYLLKMKMQGVNHTSVKALIQRIAAKLKQLFGAAEKELAVPKSIEQWLNGLLASHNAKMAGFDLANAEIEEIEISAPLYDLSFAGVLNSAGDMASDVINHPGVFNLYDKTIATQINKAMKSPTFNKFWRRVHNMFQDTNRATARPADLAKTILPKFDVHNFFEAVKTVVGKNPVKGEDLKAAHDALVAGTLHGGPSPTTGKLWADDELRDGIDTADGRHIKLSEEAIKLYHEARAAVDASISEVAAAHAWLVARRHIADEGLRHWVAENPLDAEAVLGDELAVRIDEMQDEIDTLKTAGLKENKDGTSIKVLQQRLDDARDSAKRMTEIFDKSRAFKAAGYMPLHRFGKYRVAVTFDKGPQGEDPLRYVPQFESYIEANRARRELMTRFPEAKGYTVHPVEEMDPDAWRRFRGVNPETIMLFADEVGVPADDVMQQWYKEGVSNRSALSRMSHRHGYQGYSTDLSRSLAQFITSNGKYTGNSYHMGDLEALVSEAEKGKDGGLAAEERKMLEAIKNESGGNDFSSKARSFMATWYLLGSPAAAITNLTQPIMQTGPWLYGNGAKSISKAYKLLGSAYQTIRKGDEHIKKTDKDLWDALERAQQDGTIEASEVYHLYQEAMKPMMTRLSERFGPNAGRRMQAASFIWGAPFSIAEQLNRKATFIAAFNLAREKGMDPDEAFRFAENAAHETQGLYALHNRPNWARSGFGSLAFTFKQFTITYLEQLARLALKGGVDGKKAAALQLGLLLTMSGLLGAPGEEDVEDLIDTIAQTVFGKAFVSRLELKNALEQNLGKELAGFVQHGISQFLPLDVSSRFGSANLLPGTALLKPSTGDRTREMAEFFGPAGSTASNIVDAAAALLGDGDAKRALRLAAPKAIVDVAKGIEMATTGEARNNYGGKLVNTDKWDALIQGLGYQPGVKAKDAYLRYPLQEMMNYRNKKEAHLAQQIAQGMVDNDYASVAKARRTLEDWNRKNPTMKIVITKKSLDRKVKNMRQSPSESMVKRAAPEIRSAVEKMVKDDEAE